MSEYELMPGGGLRPVASALFPEDQADDGLLRWVRLVSPHPHEIETAISTLEFSEDELELLRDADVSSQVETQGTGLVMTLPVVDPEEERAWVLRMACTATTLITVEDQALPTIDRIVTEHSRAAGTGLTLTSLFVEIIEAAAGSAGPVYLSLRRRLEDLADNVERNPREVPPEAMLSIRNDVSRLTLLWHEQVHGVRELKRCHAFIPVTDGAQNQLRDLISDGGRGLKLLSEMENRLRDLRQHQQQSLQESTNRRLNMLATVSHGYYIVMAFMTVVVLGHFWYFFRRGWFK